MNSITVEILRLGTRHNQLLSPLKEYITLCGNRDSESLRIPFEHKDILEHLEAMRYRRGGAGRGADDRRRHVEKMQDLMTSVIGRVAGLEAEAAKSKQEWIHLRLVLSPSELAMLPFELARTPARMQGGGRPLLLNPMQPITLTREVRQTGDPLPHTWRRAPRILIASTDFGDAPVPAKEHCQAIGLALEPLAWPRDAEASAPSLAPFVHIIRRASLCDIANACNEHEFTHVHLLAHGAPISSDRTHGFGIVLHHDDNRDTRDVVNADRLTTALGSPRCGGGNSPRCVVLCTCDSGAMPDVVYTGASLAQALHEIGFPLVIASQYPLSKSGSTRLTRVLYRELMSGADPRIALYHVRRELSTSLPEYHDWASVVAYTRFAEGAEQAFNWNRLARALDVLKAGKKWKRKPEEVRRRNQIAAKWLEETVEHTIPESVAEYLQYVEACGLLGSAFKREAERKREEDDPSWEQELANARDWYHKGHRPEVLPEGAIVPHWTAVQYLSLCAVLNGHLRDHAALWTQARASAERDRYSKDSVDQTWALGSLMELWMLRPLTEPKAPSEYWETASQRAHEFAAEFAKWAAKAKGDYFIPSTRDQLRRYVGWWKTHQRTPGFERVCGIAEEVLDSLPRGNLQEERKG